MSKRKKPVVFTAKHRKDLVADLGKKDYADVVETAITKMQSGLHLDLFPSRKKFVTIVCNEKVKPVLTQCIMEMVSQYIETYRRCMTGKKYLMFEQRWFNHIEQYFTQSAPVPVSSHSPSVLWNNVVERAKVSAANLPVKDQRIIVSTLAYHIHDIMVDRVKAYKESLDASTESSSSDVSTETTKLYESKTSLLRYGGFALHSMIKKRTKEAEVTPHVKSELKLLDSLKASQDESDEIPSAIHHLQKGGLHIITPKVVPLLRAVVDKTASLVNEQSCKEHGKEMLRVAEAEFHNESTTTTFFKLFMQHLPSTSTLTTESKMKLCQEFTLKIFHARINEYFSAAEEVHLEQLGKAVKAEQGLRDTLKAFSSMKSRPF